MKNKLLAVLLVSLAVARASAEPAPARPAKLTVYIGDWETYSSIHQTEPAAEPVMKEIPPGRDFTGLKAGQCDSKGNGAIHRLRVLLRKWNPALDLGADPRCYTEEAAGALTLFKAVYGSGADGHSVDPRTADLLGLMELEPARSEPPVARLFPAGEVLYRAARHLGKPYLMGADGSTAMDCGMLTRLAFMAAGVATPGFTRLADMQYLDARNNAALGGADSKGRLTLAFRKTPVPGSLVFFRNSTYQSGIAYDGVTHVALFVAGGGLGPRAGYILQAGSRGVAIDKIHYDDSGWIAGFGEILATEAKPAK